MGFFDSIGKALFGDGGEKELRRAKRRSDRALSEGYEKAGERFKDAYELFTPYAEGGMAAQERYNKLLGLGTPEEREEAQATYFSDPAFQAILGQDTNRLLKQLNARGKTYGGTAALAGARAGLENYNSYLNRLQTQGNQGFSATTNQANTRTNQANLDFGYGATRAGSEINFGNSIAQAQQSGINNLLNLAGTAAKAYAASDIRVKRDIKQVGALPSGLPIYFFRYRDDDTPHIGVMAHEAEQIFPDAVAINPAGIKMVDYSKVH